MRRRRRRGGWTASLGDLGNHVAGDVVRGVRVEHLVTVVHERAALALGDVSGGLRDVADDLAAHLHRALLHLAVRLRHQLLCLVLLGLQFLRAR